MARILPSALLFLTLLLPAIAQAANPSRLAMQKIVRTESGVVFGKERGNFHIPNYSIALAVSDLTTVGDVDEIAEIGKDIFFMSGCRPQSCDEKGAVIVNIKDHKLLAIGLRHFHCLITPEEQRAKHKRAACDHEATLTIFTLRGTGRIADKENESEFIKVIQKWGEKSYGGKVGHTHEEVKAMDVK